MSTNYSKIFEQELLINKFKRMIFKYCFLFCCLIIPYTGFILYKYTHDYKNIVVYSVLCLALFFIEYRISYMNTWIICFRETYKDTLNILNNKFSNIEKILKDIVNGK